MMKQILSILSICLIAKVNSKIPYFGDLSQYRDDCAKELGIDLETVTHPPNTGGGGQSSEPPHELKCFINCMTRRAGIVDSNGVLQTSKVSLPPGVTNIDLDKCASIKDSDPCQQIYLIDTNTFPGIDQYKDLCAQELDINVTNWEFEPTPTADDTILYLGELDRDGRCLINCMMLKAGVINENGTIQSRFIQLPNPRKCSYDDELDACERAYLIEKCIRLQLHLAIRV